MFTSIAAFLMSTAGKTAAGLAVAAATTAGAHTAGLIDVPALPDRHARPAQEQLAPDPAPAVGSLDDQPGDEPSELAAPDDDVLDDTDAIAPQLPASADHGQAVADLAHSSELEGCARGQAIAATASGHQTDSPPIDATIPTDPCGLPQQASSQAATARNRSEPEEGTALPTAAEHGEHPSQTAVDETTRAPRPPAPSTPATPHRSGPASPAAAAAQRGSHP